MSVKFDSLKLDYVEEGKQISPKNPFTTPTRKFFDDDVETVREVHSEVRKTLEKTYANKKPYSP